MNEKKDVNPLAPPANATVVTPSSSRVDELLVKIQSTRVLDLTNWTLEENEFVRIHEILDQEDIAEASLLGVNPIALKNQLLERLKAKNVQKIHYTEELDQAVCQHINNQFQQQAEEKQKVSMRFEPSRLAASYQKGTRALFKQLQKEMKGEVPKFGGDEFSTQVITVKKLTNLDIQTAYDRLKGAAVHPMPQTYLAKMQTIQMPDSVLGDGEMYLYHGTSSSVSPLIMRNGFDHNRCAYVKGNGYGPLGKGVYFTSELAKAATFARCSQCGQTEQCFCVDPETQRPADRVVLLSQVFVGSPEIALQKNKAIRERVQPQPPFNTCMSVAQEIESTSEFRSTEVCIPQGSQAIPLYEIRFTLTPNYIPADKWQAVMNLNKLNMHADLAQQIAVHFKNLTHYHTSINRTPKDVPSMQKYGALLKVQTQQLIDACKAKLNATQDPKAIKLITLQIRDLEILKFEVENYKNYDRKSALPSPAAQQLLKAHNPVLEHTRFKDPATAMAPKAVHLKLELFKVVDEMRAAKPGEFIPIFLHFLETDLIRNKNKDNFLSRGSYPAHRIILNQEIIQLKEKLKTLDSNDLTKANAILRASIQNLSTLADPKIHYKVSKSTVFKLLEQSQKILEHKIQAAKTAAPDDSNKQVVSPSHGCS